MTNDSSKHNDSSQAERFREAARSLGADEDEAAFKTKLAVIARQKPKDEPKAPKRPRKP
jgi:hypothetical protein